MKKRILSLLLALVMCLSLLPTMALAASEPTKIPDPPTISNLSIGYSDNKDQLALFFDMQYSDSMNNAIDYYENHERGYNQVGYISGIAGQYSVDGEEWQDIGVSNDGEGGFQTYWTDDIKVDSYVQFRVRADGWDERWDSFSTEWSNVLKLNEKASVIASAWAQDELAEADALGLIPEVLVGADLTKPITRAEFAAVAVKVYENLSGVAAIPAVNNPFTDCKDIEVLKAYNVGITAGTSATTFSPNVILNREQAATMLTRVFKKVSIPGWTQATDSEFKLEYTKPAAFADDKDISDWAKDSVYFMAANGIIAGVGNNTFAPRAVTPAQQAQGYAQATREQALLIAVRMVQNLGN